MLRRIISIGLPVGILIFAIVGVGGYLQSNKPRPEASNDERPALAVFAEQIERRDLTIEVTAQGEVRPRAEIDVTPQVAGRIAYISDDFVDGGFIPKGGVIIRLDQTDYELSVVRAQSGVAAARQALAREQAEADLAIRDLESLGVSASSPLARREPQLAEAQAALDSANAQLREARLALERSVIRAPFDARVRSKSVDLGQFVATGQSLGRVFSTDIVEVALPLTDEQIGQLALPIAFSETPERPGATVVFRATVGGEMHEWTGRITRTAAAVNSQSRLINVFGELKDPYGAGSDDGTPMAPGLFVTAYIQGQTYEDILWAPRSALRGNNELYLGVRDPEKDTFDIVLDGSLDVVKSLFGGRTPVFKNRQSGGKLSIRTIDVLFSDENGAYFQQGAETGELAIVSPIQAAFDGMRLNIRERYADGFIVEETQNGTTGALVSAIEGEESQQ